MSSKDDASTRSKVKRPSLRRHVAGSPPKTTKSERRNRCTCVEDVSRALAKQGTCLRLSRRIDGSGEFTDGVPIIATDRLDDRRRRGPGYVLVPTHCPFCGVEYLKEKSR